MTDVLPASTDSRASYPQGPPPRRRITRRGLLTAAGAGLVAVGAATAAVNVWQGIQDGQDEPVQPGHRPPRDSVQPARVEQGSFFSVNRGRPTGYAVIHPPGVPADAQIPVVLAMHGWRDDHEGLLGPRFQLPAFLAEAVAAGVPPFRIVAADAGRSYYHPHQGEDAGTMLIDEFLPRLAARGLPTSRQDRIGLLGWSMGGYGALRLGGLLGAQRIGALCAVSPALWLDPAEPNKDGFSTPAEYLRFSVLHRYSDLAGIPVRIDCGRNDRFVQATRAYVAGFPRPIKGAFTPGIHASSYWRRVLPDELSFLGSTLAA